MNKDKLNIHTLLNTLTISFNQDILTKISAIIIQQK